METIEYRTMDKSLWERGPWDNEPDKKQWKDEATGLPCLIVRNNLGALCGYVGVSKGNPHFKKNYNDVGADVHGGLTFAGSCMKFNPKYPVLTPEILESEGICHIAPGNDDVWWLGFDCHHFGDIGPASSLFLKSGRFNPLEFGATYKAWEYVVNEVTQLARQLYNTSES